MGFFYEDTCVIKQLNSLKNYSASGIELNIPQIYIPLYPAGTAVGTLSDFLRLAMALIPNETGKSPLFQKAETLQDFSTTSLLLYRWKDSTK